MRDSSETCTKTGMVMIFGEITTSATVNYEQVNDRCPECMHSSLTTTLSGYQRGAQGHWVR